MGEEAKSSDVKFFSAEMIIRRSGFRRLATPCDFAFNTNISDEIVKCVDIYETDQGPHILELPKVIDWTWSWCGGK